MSDKPRIDKDSKSRELEPARVVQDGQYLTTEEGVRVDDTDNHLKVGERGPALLEDFHLREKITHFDHERIPERVVHARGAGAHGYFQCYAPLTDLTRASVFRDPAVKTPAFVRFSTVLGSRGSNDTPRDVRGFAVKLYTDEGIWDLVGNNIPVFFIQDGIKFPDLVHAAKPEPNREIPQAGTAHDTFWDFASLVPEITHMLMWALSDRAIPRSLRMMQGFGVHTFRLIDEAGKSSFVKFHWKPLLGVHSLVWDEAQKIAGKDADFHRRDLWEAIAAGAFPEYELGVQVVPESDEHAFDFDLLDATKLIPEELVPVRPVGKLTLDRNPDNFFAETEQVAFCTANVVPGIDFTDDPLLQIRNFSYLDTQITRLGGPNFTEIPINRSVAPVVNNHRDGHMQMRIPVGRTAYTPNSLGGGCPALAPGKLGAFVHHAERVSGETIRKRSPSFGDHYSQATLFYASMSEPEKKHILQAARFELGKVVSEEVRKRMVDGFARVDLGFARAVAEGIGVPAPAAPPAAPARAAAKYPSPAKSPALSQASTLKTSIQTRHIAVLVADGADGAQVSAVSAALKAEGAVVSIVSTRLGKINAAGGAVKADATFRTTASVLFDAVYVPGGAASVAALSALGDAIHFVREAFKHSKPIGATGEGVELLLAATLPGVTLATSAQASKTTSHLGVVSTRAAAKLDDFARAFVEAIAQHRFWDRDVDAVPA